MSTSQELKATERDTTLTPRKLRAAGFVPATIYGKGAEPQSIQVRAHEFQQAFTQGVRDFQLTGFVNLVVKAQQVQRDPVTQVPISIEFLLTGNAAAEGKSRKSAKAEKANEAAPVEAPEAETALSGV